MRTCGNLKGKDGDVSEALSGRWSLQDSYVINH